MTTVSYISYIIYHKLIRRGNPHIWLHLNYCLDFNRHGKVTSSYKPRCIYLFKKKLVYDIYFDLCLWAWPHLKIFRALLSEQTCLFFQCIPNLKDKKASCVLKVRRIFFTPPPPPPPHRNTLAKGLKALPMWPGSQNCREISVWPDPQCVCVTDAKSLFYYEWYKCVKMLGTLLMDLYRTKRYHKK